MLKLVQLRSMHSEMIPTSCNKRTPIQKLNICFQQERSHWRTPAQHLPAGCEEFFPLNSSTIFHGCAPRPAKCRPCPALKLQERIPGQYLPHSQIIGCGITQPLPPYNDEFAEFTLYSSLDFHQIQIPGRVTFELNAAKGPPSHHPQNREVTEGVFHVRAEWKSK